MTPDELAQLMRTCRCGGDYSDTAGGRHSHRIVFGHGPVEAPPDYDVGAQG